MYLDERRNNLLKEVLQYPNITNADLQKKFNLTRRQIDYSFQKINSWLEENAYPKIHRSASGHFVIDPYLFQMIGDEGGGESNWYILSDMERANLIILMLATYKEELSLNHFISELGVSKNTVLRDLKLVQKNLDKYGLVIKYSRLSGYLIDGDEWNQRTALIFTMESIIESFNGEELLKRFLNVDENRMISLREKLEQVESYLNLQFIDSKMKILPYILEAIFRRIEKGGTIKESFLVDYEELSDTKEYGAAEILIKDELSISEEERMYITLQLLVSNVLPKQYLKFEEAPQLKSALVQVLSKFEKKSCIQLVDKEKLLEKLFVHMKPAYYRIKYHLTTDYSMLDGVEQEFQDLHYVVLQSLKPLESFLETKIPENESVFITLFIAGHLIEVEEKLQTRVKAVVVCPNGMSLSRLMEQTLRSLFPEIFFYQAMSVREFEKTKVTYDIVFSSVPLSTDKKFFLIHQLMNERGQLELRARVLRCIYKLDENQVSVNGLLKIISPYVEIKDREKLEKLLAEYLLPSSIKRMEMGVEGTENLYGLLTPEQITRVKCVSSWHKAIEIASEPLLKSGAITKGYVTEMKKQYPVPGSHIILRGNIAIPHAETGKGVNHLGMSLLYVEEGLPLEDGTTLHFIVVIAPVDKKAHFQALLQLMELSGVQEELDKLKRVDTLKEMHDAIKKFVLIKLKGKQEII